MDILESCEEWGRGGVAPIGHGVGWRVVVVGFRMPGGPDGGGADGGEDVREVEIGSEDMLDKRGLERREGGFAEWDEAGNDVMGWED